MSNETKVENPPVVADKRNISTSAVAKEVIADKKEIIAAKKEGRKVRMSSPPPPPIKVGEVANPILGTDGRGLKRALTVAIVKACTSNGKLDEVKASTMIRSSGILFKSGYDKDTPTDALSSGEWTGKPYVRFVTNTDEGKNYDKKHPEKVEKCVPFATALKTAVDKEEKIEAKKEKEETNKVEEPKKDVPPVTEVKAEEKKVTSEPKKEPTTEKKVETEVKKDKKVEVSASKK